MSSNVLRNLAEKEKSRLDSAVPFDPYERYTEVHSHKVIKFCQNGIYYDAVGNAVSVKPEKPKVRLGIKRLREGIDGNKIHDSLPRNSHRVVGATSNHKLPPNVVKAQIENQRARMAEEYAE